MNRHDAQEDTIAFRLPPRLGKNLARMLLAALFALPVLGGLSLMGATESPLLNSTGLVLVLLAVMTLMTRWILRRGTAAGRPVSPARKYRGHGTTPRNSPGARSLVADLSLLAALHARGQLTDAEFAAGKAKLLDGA